VFFSSGYNYEEHAQVIERIGPLRQLQAGLNRNVFIYKIVANGTAEEKVIDVLEGKASLQEAIMGK